MLTRALEASVRVLVALLGLGWGAGALAATCTASTGNWGTAGIWSCGHVPVNGDNVVIPNGVTVTLNVNTARINDLNVQAGGVLQGDNTNKTFTIDNGTGTDITNNGTIDFGAGTLATMFTRRSTTWGGSGSWTFSEIDLNGNTLAFAAGTTATIVMSGVAAPFTNAGTVNSTTTITWDFSGSVAQTLPNTANVHYGNVIVSNTAGVTLGVALTSTNILGNLTVASGGILNNAGLAMTLAAGKSLQVQANGTLNLTGTSTMVAVSGGGTKTFDAASTVNYGGASQNVTAETYGNLRLTGSGTKTMATGTTTIAGDLTLASGVTYNGTTNNPTVNLAGDLSDSGTFNSGTGTFTFNGGSAQALSGTSANTTFTNMRMNGAGGLTLGHNATVATLLTLSNGVVTTGTNTLITSANCPGSISRTSGHIAGNLQLRFATGAQTCTFHVGDGSVASYTPVAVTFTNVSTAGSLIGSTAAGDYSDTNTPVDGQAGVNRSWSLSLPGAGALAFTGSYSTAFTYLASDDDAGATASKYIVGRGASCAPGCTWTLPTVSGTPTATSATATGMTSMGTVFVIGERRVADFLVEQVGGGSIGTQTQNVAFSIRITARDPQGNTVTQFTGTVDLTSSCTLSAGGGTTASFTAGVLTSTSVTISSTGTCAITATKTGDTETGTSNTFNVNPNVASFNAVEPGANAVTGKIFTKIAGQDIAVDIVALDASNAVTTTFTGTVTVEIVDATSGGACSGLPLIKSLTNQTFTLANAGRHPLSSPNAEADAWRNARIRIKYPTASPTITSCSTDNFAVRPSSLSSFSVSDTNRTTAGTTRALTNNVVTVATVHNAGKPFTIQATGINAAAAPAVTSRYDGSPGVVVTRCTSGGVNTACTASTVGTLSAGTWSASGGTVTTSTASYNDVGAFTLQLEDTTFASVDNGDGSTAAQRTISSATMDVGRFVPNHFTVSVNAPVFGTFCGFTYVGQKFSYAALSAPQITVTARDAAGNATPNYTDTAWLRRVFSGDGSAGGTPSLTGRSYAAAGGWTLDTSGQPNTDANPDPLIATTGSGVFTLTFSSGTGFSFTRTTPSAPFDADIGLSINVIDADGVVYENPVGTGANPVRFGLASAGNGIAFSSSKEMRFGRLRVLDISGAANATLPVRMRTEYYNAGLFTVNTLDSCTQVARRNVAMTFTGLGTCATALNATPITFASGSATPILTAPNAAGTADMRVNLAADNGTTACNPANVAPTNAGLPHLQGLWASGSTGYTDDPVARATFGTYGQDRLPSNMIFRRENF